MLLYKGIRILIIKFSLLMRNQTLNNIVNHQNKILHLIPIKIFPMHGKIGSVVALSV